ncbi:unnamed protein product [Blepharisma stoltei]|uniref:Large ribosomal subunit protein uL23m n=1 Tax=Blepharisma stoltei TaxID=1481888 RepID=A0AAU9JYX6_9CILI|nr:unnamed protein product [Blepharisma stoltei]
MDKLIKLRPNLIPRLLRPEPKVYKFFNKPIYLVRTEKELQENVLCFRCPQELTKPELRQVFTKVYGMKLKAVSTFNHMGKIARNRTNGHYRKPDYKKVYVELEHEAPPYLQYFKNI